MPVGSGQPVCEGRHPLIGIDPLFEDPATRYIPPVADIGAACRMARGDQRDFVECIYYLAAGKSSG